MDKPLALTANEAKKLIELSREKGCILYTALPRMHSALYRVISEYIRSGSFGKIIDYEFVYHRPRYPDFRNSWRNSKECGGGVLIDAGYHIIYMLLALTDSPAHSIKCIVSNHDLEVEVFVKISAKFGNNSIASVSLAAHEIPNLIQEKIYICGTKGILTYIRNKVGTNNDSKELLLLKNDKQQSLSIVDKDDLDILPLKHFIQLYKSNTVNANLLDIDLSVIQFIETAYTNAKQNHD
jgi:predicted dehydrogenase